MIRQIYQLVLGWWTSDRIRVPPAEGRFLRINPGDLLTLEGTEVEVLARYASEGQSLCLRCRTEAGLAELHVTISSDRGLPELVWNEFGKSRLLSVHDVQVWPRRFQSAPLQFMKSRCRFKPRKPA